MIYFASKPDVVFTLILHEALEEALDDIKGVVELKDNVGWEWSYPCSFRCLNPEIAAKVVKQLLAISKEPDPYRITDYHYLLLFDCLRNYCEQFNALAEEEPSGSLQLGEHKFREIDCEGLIETFFWDTDFAYSPELMDGIGEKVRKEMGMTEEVFGVAQGWTPHIDELKVEHVDEVRWSESEPNELFRPGSTQYPDIDIGAC